MTFALFHFTTTKYTENTKVRFRVFRGSARLCGGKAMVFYSVSAAGATTACFSFSA
jgi:hypothetical protein